MDGCSLLEKYILFSASATSVLLMIQQQKVCTKCDIIVNYLWRKPVKNKIYLDAIDQIQSKSYAYALYLVDVACLAALFLNSKQTFQGLNTPLQKSVNINCFPKPHMSQRFPLISDRNPVFPCIIIISYKLAIILTSF